MYKMVAIDLDDTLLTDDHEITIENSRAISKALEMGVAVCLVSGRSYSSIKRYIEYLKLSHLTGSLNGACIIEPFSDKLLHSFSIDKALGCEIIKRIEGHGVHINFYHGYRVVCKEKNQFSELYRSTVGTEAEYVGVLSEYALSTEAGKLLLLDKTEKLEEIRLELLECYGDQINMTYSKPDFLEIYRKDISKGQALKKIADFYGIGTDEIIAIGDGENDISMIQCAGMGVAMGNAPLKVKESADFVTYSNNESGVAHALNKLLLSDV